MIIIMVESTTELDIIEFDGINKKLNTSSTLLPRMVL